MRARHTTLVVLAVLMPALFAACAEQEITYGALFAAPSGLAVAGSPDQTRYLFIANSGEDALQVLALGSALSEVAFVTSPAQYFPLRIPAGPNPTDLVPTADGRFVVVLNEASDSICLIDADTLAQVRNDSGDDEGKPHRLVFGSERARSAHLVASPRACGGDCSGLVYVALSGLGAVAEVAVIDHGVGSGQTGEMELRRMFSVGGEPARLALDSTGRLLFATDAAAPEIVRLDLTSGAMERRPIGGLGGPIAVSQDDTLLIVGRPAERDLIVLAGATDGAFAAFDADPAWAPQPACVAPCANPTHCPASTHPADTAVCRRNDALIETAGEPYGAIFLNVAPVEIVALGAIDDGQVLRHELLAPTCGNEDPPGYRQYALVATLDGMVWYVTLRDRENELAVGLLDQTWCEAPELSVNDDGGIDGFELDQLLAPCPTVPERRRFACAEERVLVMPGATGVKDLQLTWEDVIVDRSGGGGVVTAEGSFTDVGIDLRYEPIEPNDVLEVLTEASAEAACVAAVGEGIALCELERRIVAVETTGGDQTVLRLDAPLAPDCFPSGGGVAYRIRAGDQFRVVPLAYSDLTGTWEPEGRRERLSPGDWLGPFGEHGRDYRIALGLLSSLEPRAELPACERYGAGGLAGPLVRDAPIWLTVDDRYRPIRLAETGIVFGYGTPTGYLPSAMITTKIGGGAGTSDSETTPELQVVYVAYAGEGSGFIGSEPPLEGVLAFVPVELERIATIDPDEDRDVIWKME